MKDKKARVKQLVWNPAEWKHNDTPELKLATPPLTTACDRLVQRSRTTGTRARMLNEVAGSSARANGGTSSRRPTTSWLLVDPDLST